MNWSITWKSSKQPRKQRKYVREAPLHRKSKLLGSHLSKELKTKHKMRSLRLVKGDKVKVMRGTFKGKTGKVERIDVNKSRAYITGVEFIKRDGSKASYPIRTSNLLIQDLNLSDKKRLGGQK